MSSLGDVISMHKKVYIAPTTESALVLVEKLNEQGISAFQKNEGSGGVMKIVTGVSFMGNAVYVKNEDVEKALQIVEAFRTEELPNLPKQQYHFSKANRIAALICVIVLVLLILFHYYCVFSSSL